MTRIISARAEEERGYRRLPSPGGHRWIWGTVITAILFTPLITGAGLWFIGAIFLLLLADALGKEIRRTRIATKLAQSPGVSVIRSLGNGALLVDFYGKQTIALGLSHLIGENTEWQLWLEKLCWKLDRPIKAVMTSGIPNVHAEDYDDGARNEKGINWQYLLLMDVGEEHPEDESANLLAAIPASISKYDPTLLFEVSGAHGWSVSHCYSERTSINQSIPYLIHDLDYVRNVDITAIVHLHPDRKSGVRTLGIGIDVFLFGDNANRLKQATAEVIIGPKIKGPPFTALVKMPPRIWRSEFALMEVSTTKLNHAAIFVRAPVCALTEYECISEPSLPNSSTNKMLKEMTEERHAEKALKVGKRGK